MRDTQRKSTTTDDTILDSYELAQQVAQIREDLQYLTSIVLELTSKQVGRAQDAAKETAHQVDQAIRENPLSAIAIAAALGFLLGSFMRR